MAPFFQNAGLNSTSYHLVNIVLHSLVTLCVTLLMKPMIRRPWIRCAAGLTFAAHPIHCEAVASVVGRAELGAALHTLVALLAYRAHLRARRRLNGDDMTREEERGGVGWTKKRRIECGQEELLIESTRARRNPFQRRQSPLSLFIRRVTICCCWSDLKKSQYRPASPPPSSSSNNGSHRAAANRRHHHQEQQHEHDDGDDEFGDRWESGAYLAASLTAAASAILWKETGMAAIPLCAIIEFIEQLPSAATAEPGNRQSSDRHHQVSIVHPSIYPLPLSTLITSSRTNGASAVT